MLNLQGYQELLTTAYQRGNKPVRLLGLGIRLADQPLEEVQLDLF